MSEKDPFESYDHFWDELDNIGQEEIEKKKDAKKEKNYQFDDRKAYDDKHTHRKTISTAKIVFIIIISIGVLNNMIHYRGFLNFPIILIIMLVIAISSILKGDKSE